MPGAGQKGHWAARGVHRAGATDHGEPESDAPPTMLITRVTRGLLYGLGHSLSTLSLCLSHFVTVYRPEGNEQGSPGVGGRYLPVGPLSRTIYERGRIIMVSRHTLPGQGVMQPLAPLVPTTPAGMSPSSCCEALYGMIIIPLTGGQETDEQPLPSHRRSNRHGRFLLENTASHAAKPEARPSLHPVSVAPPHTVVDGSSRHHHGSALYCMHAS